MSTESLKAQARRHEQEGKWARALELYLQVLEVRGGEDETEIGLHHRVGDLYVRLGDLDAAEASYNRAIDLYLRAELPNNAVAVCRKLIRHAPGRPAPFLRMARIRVEQGFVVDARESFLTYAEMQKQRGDSDEALRSLAEFVELVPDEVESRVLLAEGLVGKDRIEEAVKHLVAAHRTLLERGANERAAEVADQLRELAPGQSLGEPHADEQVPEAGSETDPAADLPPLEKLAGFESTSLDVQVPTADEGNADDAGEDAPPRTDAGEPAAPEPEFDDAFGLAEFSLERPEEDPSADAFEEDDTELPPLPTLDLDGDEPESEQPEPDTPEEVELFAEGDIFHEIDLGSEGSAERGPVPEDGGPTHYDRGKAFLEAGLLDRAIEAFELSLEDRPRDLDALEMLGQALLEAGEPASAIEVLMSCIHIPVEAETDRVGIYYLRGRAHEDVRNTGAAREFYEKVSSLDMNFRDLAERLRSLE